MKLLEICFVKLIIHVSNEAAMKLLVNTLREIGSEIAGEIAVTFCTLVFIREMNFTVISPAISLATSRGGLLAISRQISLAISLSTSRNKLWAGGNQINHENETNFTAKPPPRLHLLCLGGSNI